MLTFLRKVRQILWNSIGITLLIQIFHRLLRSISSTPKQNEALLIFKTTKNAKTPTKATPDSAGFDLYSSVDTIIPAFGQAHIRTGLVIAVPSGTYGRIAPRSGLALRYNLDVGGGVIDADYRGDIIIILFNHGPQNFHVHIGDRIAQLICEKISYPNIIETKSLRETIRGINGFGSSGIQ